MRRKTTLLFGVALVSLMGCVFWKQRRIAPDPVAEAALASPALADIQRALAGEIALRKGETPEDAKRRLFGDMFKKRFRDSTPTVAIGMRFDSPASARIYFPARLEPYYRDRIAYTAWREIKAALGVSCTITLWDTYIGIPPEKTGELKPEANAPDRVRITHTFIRKQYAP